MMTATTGAQRVPAICRCRTMPRRAPLWVVRETAQWLAAKGIVLPSTLAMLVWQCPACHHRTTLTVQDLRIGGAIG